MPARKNSRNAQGGGTIRQRKDGLWEARYTLPRDPGTGKQVQKSIYGKTQKEVRQRLQQMTTNIDNGVYLEPSQLTVRQWLDIWLAEYLGEVKPRTVASYSCQVKNHIIPAIGAVKLSSLTTPAIQSLYNQKHRDEGLSPKTIKNLHGVLHKALSQAVSIRYLQYNPANACKLPRIMKADVKPLDEEQISAFIQAAQGSPYESLYLVTLFTGMRQGEVLGLTWDCVDFKSGTLLINKQLQRERNGSGEHVFVSPKNDKSRLITLAPSVVNILKDVQVIQLENRLRAGDAWYNDMNLVFTNELGHNLSSQTVYLHFKKLAVKIGAPNTRFHDLRHSYAVASLQSGDDIKTVQENLGHHTAAFTLDVYGHVTKQMKKDSAARMESFIQGVSNL